VRSDSCVVSCEVCCVMRLLSCALWVVRYGGAVYFACSVGRSVLCVVLCLSCVESSVGCCVACRMMRVVH